MSLPPLAIMEARCRELEHELAHATRELRRLREKDADARILAATREHAEDELSDLMQKRSLERSRRRKLLEILASELSAATDGIITVSHSDKTVKDQLECLVLTTRGGSASLDSDSTQDDPLNGVKSMCACRMLLSQQMLAIVFVGRFRQAEIPRQSKISDIEKVQVRRHEPETAWRTVILHLPNRVRTLLVPPSLSAVALLRQLRSILPKDSWHETFDEETATTDESHETPSVASEERGTLSSFMARGGGEYGQAWHEAGTKHNKQNVFDDFAFVAQYLQEHKYTTRDLLAIMGGSNGGLLVGAVANQYPDLMAAAVPCVGVMDMLRFHKFTIGYAWTSDYGCADDPEEFENLHRLSPLHNIPASPQQLPHGRFPATLVMTADHDDRVVPLHSLKYTAELQHRLGALETPLLLHVDTKAGHGAGKALDKTIEERALVFAFLDRVLGDRTD
ncbi:MAG: hypothetical protein MHM6MM_001377 [Cercozoa sp. M6MM]